MSELEQRDNSGILFKNDRKEKESHSDYRGNATINGIEYFMDAWLKQGQKGKFMSFSFKKKSGKFNQESRGEETSFPRRESPRLEQRTNSYRDKDDGIPL